MFELVDSLVWTNPNVITNEYSKLTRGYCPCNFAVKKKLDILRGSQVFLDNEDFLKSILKNKTVTEDQISLLLKKEPELYNNLTVSQKILYNSL